MGLFTFIICLLILLLLLIVIGTIQEFTLWVVTRKDHEFVVMLVPSLVSLITFGITALLTHYILKLFDINIINILYSEIMNFEYNFNSFIGMVLGLVLFSVVYIILQALCLKLVNIDYGKIYIFIKQKILKKEDIKGLGSSPEEQNEKASVDLTHNALPALPTIETPFFHYIAASLFSVSICLFSISLLIYIGMIIGEKYII